MLWLWPNLRLDRPNSFPHFCSRKPRSLLRRTPVLLLQGLQSSAARTPVLHCKDWGHQIDWADGAGTFVPHHPPNRYVKSASFWDYPPKLSNIRFDIGTPRSSSIFSTAFDMGPGPHIRCCKSPGARTPAYTSRPQHRPPGRDGPRPSGRRSWETPSPGRGSPASRRPR